MDSMDESSSDEGGPLFPDDEGNDSDESFEDGVMPVDDDDEYSRVEDAVKSSEDEDEHGGEESEDDDEVDTAAWGKKRHTYYSTDYVDQDFGGFEGSDAEMAEEEEQEALSLQKKLIEHLDDADFGTSIFKKTDVKQPESEFENVAVNVTDLSKSEKLKLLNTESPELLRIINDVKEKFEDLKNLLNLMDEKNELLEKSETVKEYCDNKVQLVLHYCMNALLYLSMKMKRVPVSNHPVRKRIVNFNQLLEQLVNLRSLKSIGNNLEKNSTLSLISKKKDKKTEKMVHFNEEDVDNDQTENLDSSALDKEEEEESDKRAINRQIAKNRGLTPRRKKEYKNPRVKHRIMFKKAKTRRRGQVREPRTELKRYDGEISGIKIGVRKGIKLK